MSEEKRKNEFVKWFSELNNKDVNVAGGKGASLAEMYNNDFPVPPGFVITAQAYKYFIDKSGLDDKIKKILNGLDIEDTSHLNEVSKKIREMISNADMPKDLEDEIIEAYDILDEEKKKIGKAGSGALEILKTGHEPPFVAVRSSATTEDLAEASFAGQQETFLNVKGKKELISKVKDCFASLFTARATYYREKKGFQHDKAYLAVVVQRMIDSEKSGVIFSQNPIGKDDNIVIEAVWGLGEGIVSGQINPDNYAIDSNMENFKILSINIGNKKIAIVRNSSGANETVKLSNERGKQQVLTNYEIKILSQYSKRLEKHYGKPQDIEFAIEGNDIYIVQSRPITTLSSKREEREIDGKVLLSGFGASPGISSGIVRIVKDIEDLSKIKQGDVLVTKMTNPDMVVAMQKSTAIVTDEGGVTSHAAIVSREMGIPAVVGTDEATKKLHEGEVITVDGNSGKVFEGKAETRLAEIKPIIPTKTKIKVIVDLPDFAQRAAKSGAKAIGLTRIEGIIASSGKHPMKYVKEGKIKDYVKVLVSGLKRIAEPFDEIWIRSSDIRSDEFRHLEGSPKEIEGNPMLGDHGIRFSLKHLDIMKAELTAIKEIADDFPNKIIGIMAPQIISVEEVRKMKSLANEIGMPKNTKIGIMVETPAAVQIINSLCEEGINFVSFGTNDLTQYTLAIDRNNSDVQELYNELHPAVLNSLAYVIRACKKYGVETSICGQAGSNEKMVKFLMSYGIDSLSVNADAARKVSELVSKLESEIYGVETKKEAISPEVESQLETGHIEVPMAKAQNYEIKNNSSEDIEDVILKELDNEKDDYESDSYDKKKEIPPLNDAIPIESEDLNQKEQEKEINLTELNENKEELKKEWKGERSISED